MCKKIFRTDDIQNLIETGGIFGLINKHNKNPVILKEIGGKINEIKREREKDFKDEDTDDEIEACLKNIEYCKKGLKREKSKKRKKEKRNKRSFNKINLHGALSVG